MNYATAPFYLCLAGNTAFCNTFLSFMNKNIHAFDLYIYVYKTRKENMFA